MKTTFSIIFQLLFDENQLKHIYTFFSTNFVQQLIFIAVNCLAQKKCNEKKWHSKSRSRFCLIKMTLFKEHDCIYLHNRNRSSNSCNAVQQAYVNSRLAIYLRFVNEITELLGITAADCIMRGVRMCSCMGFL